jgi:hypothetical protein
MMRMELRAVFAACLGARRHRPRTSLPTPLRELLRIRIGLLSVCLAYAGIASAQQSLVIAQGVPLYIRVTREAPLHPGARVQGILTRPVWVGTRLALPAGSRVFGNVLSLEAAPHEERLKAVLNGDLTPLHVPVVDFSSVVAEGQTISMQSTARVQAVNIVRFVATPHTPLARRLIQMAKQKVHQEYDMVFGPNKRERAVRLLYQQLPYHPQRIWTNTEFVADLSAAVAIEESSEASPVFVSSTDMGADLPAVAIAEARLVSPLSSDTSHRGDPVNALVTAPVFDKRHHVLLEQGATLRGVVHQVKPSKSFGRNGALRFSFEKVVPVGATRARPLYGTLSGAAGDSKSNIEVDAEGKVEAQPQSNRFLAPLVLGVLAVHGQDDDGSGAAQGVAANGLGLVARIIAVTVGNGDVATGFGAYGFAKSIYFRFLARGHAVKFPADTPIEVQLSSR